MNDEDEEWIISLNNERTFQSFFRHDSTKLTLCLYLLLICEKGGDVSQGSGFSQSVTLDLLRLLLLRLLLLAQKPVIDS